LGVETTLTLLPVRAAQASAPMRHCASSLPTAPHEMASVAAVAGAAASRTVNRVNKRKIAGIAVPHPRWTSYSLGIGREGG